LGFEEIIGDSPALKRVLGQVKIVAVTDATVLILGETGTGKELIARAVHRMGKRSANSFIKMNCAAIPTGLLESELFGHEKGAFTGAINQQIETITSETMKSLMNWDWPGNVRELENFVERSVILTEGTLLRTPPVEPREEYETGATVDTSFEGAEREHIIRILRETRGLI